MNCQTHKMEKDISIEDRRDDDRRKPIDDRRSPRKVLLQAHLAKSLHAWQLIACGLLVVVIMMVFAFITLLPLKEIQPRFIEFSTSRDNFFKVLPVAGMPVEQKRFLIKKFLRNYVINRETYDNMKLMEKRMVRVAEMSSQEEFKKLQKDWFKKKSNMKDTLREIFIISDSVISKDVATGISVHQVEFRTLDTKGDYYIKQLWLATITYGFKDEELNEEKGMINPLNLKIQTYVISKRQNEANEIIQDHKESTPFKMDVQGEKDEK